MSVRAEEILNAVQHGQSFTIVRDGDPIGRLVPLTDRGCTPRDVVIAAFRAVPTIDVAAFGRDSDGFADQHLFNREW